LSLGVPAAFFKVYFGEPNKDPKLFPKEPFSDQAFQTAISAIQTLDASGFYASEIFLNGAYSIQIDDTDDVLFKEAPNIPANILGLIVDLGDFGTDTTAAQAAIDALPTSGGTIIVPDVTYTITAASLNIGTKVVTWQDLNGNLPTDMPGTVKTQGQFSLPETSFQANRNVAIQDYRKIDETDAVPGVRQYEFHVEGFMTADVSASNREMRAFSFDLGTNEDDLTGDIRGIKGRVYATGGAGNLRAIYGVADGGSGGHTGPLTGLLGTVYPEDNGTGGEAVGVRAHMGLFSTSAFEAAGTSREISIETGTHDGLANAAFLTDTSKSFTVNEFRGLIVQNTTDGSEGVITANTATTVTATLSGGTDNDWDISDAYIITGETHGFGYRCRTGTGNPLLPLTACFAAHGGNGATDGDMFIGFKSVTQATVADAPYRVKSTGVTMSAGFFTGAETIADNAFIQVTPPAVSGMIEVFAESTSQAFGKYYYRVAGGALTTEAYSGTLTEALTGALNGTTGVDGDLTISSDSGGTIYIENRLGASKSMVYTIWAKG